MRKRVSLVAVLAAGTFFVAACGSDNSNVSDTTMAPDTTEATATGDIIDVATGAGSFKTLAAALQAAGLVDTLKGAGPFTVFAPTDEAFAALPAGLVDKLLLPENVETLKRILLFHVVSGSKVTSDMVAAGDVEMASGDKATITVEGTNVSIAGVAVTSVDVQASNGVIHVLGGVMVPADIDINAFMAG